jgi:hypothetical protein
MVSRVMPRSLGVGYDTEGEHIRRELTNLMGAERKKSGQDGKLPGYIYPRVVGGGAGKV